MRKALLTVLLVSVIVFVSISFMAASCIVGPVTLFYDLTVENQYGLELVLEIHRNPTVPSLERQVFVPANFGSTRVIAGESGYYLKVWGPWGYLPFDGQFGNDYELITEDKSFLVDFQGIVNSNFVTQER